MNFISEVSSQFNVVTPIKITRFHTMTFVLIDEQQAIIINPQISINFIYSKHISHAFVYYKVILNRSDMLCGRGYLIITIWKVTFSGAPNHYPYLIYLYLLHTYIICTTLHILTHSLVYIHYTYTDLPYSKQKLIQSLLNSIIKTQVIKTKMQIKQTLNVKRFLKINL